MKQFLGVLFLICLILLITFCDGSATVHVNGSLIVDDAGRVRIFHGANFVNQGFPWYRSELLHPDNVASLAQIGINFIRLGYLLFFYVKYLYKIKSFRMMWSGVEPEPQQYNVTYLNIVKQTVELLQSHGIFVLFDMHQDVLSSRTGSYDGIPAWLYDRFPPPAHPCNEQYSQKIILFLSLLFSLIPWPLKNVTGISWFDL